MSNVRGDAARSVAGSPGVSWEPMEQRHFDEISRSAVVSGHFYLPTLLRVTEPASIATVLREPRTRVLSLYTFWRITPGYEQWYPYRPHYHALKSLDEFLLDPLMASAVDNVVCRILLHGDSRIPEDDFISAEEVGEVAEDAIAQLDRLGLVDVIELGQSMWERLSLFFRVRLESGRANVTASSGMIPETLPFPGPISDRTIELLRARTAADAIAYRHVLATYTTEARATRIADSTFAAQLVRIGDIGGHSAASLGSLTSRLADSEGRLSTLSEELSARHDAKVAGLMEQLAVQQEAVRKIQTELENQRVWLDGIQRSASWRLTAPLRAAKRLMTRWVRI